MAIGAGLQAIEMNNSRSTILIMKQQLGRWWNNESNGIYSFQFSTDDDVKAD